jgi:hypothetical protein
VLDSEIIKKFTDGIFVPEEVIGQTASKNFNKFLSTMSRLARRRISQ